MTTYNEVLDSAIESLKEYIECNDIQEETYEIQDAISEIADNAIPIYNCDIFSVFAEGGISYQMDDTGLIEGCDDVIQILQMRIYEELSNDLYHMVRGLINEYVYSLEEE
ncbi:hypothetical protein [Proteus phage PM 116]|uniref:Uncharacterized protein n=1 Tax=Proteus phage PM 116 TaxID=1837877 RepID=A0A2D0VKP0_9CAUD|nr:ocr-like anti-restriction [Proteus phage PM 116]ANU80087.1 hypothetical protein [Proteus phage PM 116]